LGPCIHHDHQGALQVDGLTSYKAHWFAVQALGTDGPGAMSIPIIGRSA
jgi:hypothetical protein